MQKEKDFSQKVKEGQSVYNPLVLQIYDIVVTHISNTFIWKCPADKMLKAYIEKIGQKHLDIGVGSGYYLKKVKEKGKLKDKKIDLMDLNENALLYTQKRIQLKSTKVFKHNIFETMPLDCKDYDSVGLNFLFHCIPGTYQKEKAKAISNAVSVLKEKGVLFGATIVKADKKSSILAHQLMQIYNIKGIFHNTEDSQEDLEQALNQSLVSVKTKRYGSVVLFSGMKQ